MTAVLGISAYYHDSAAALVVDGQIIAAAQEERFTRIKHDSEFPASAVAYCLRTAELEVTDLDHVVFYEKPLLKFDRLLETYLATAPRGLRAFLQAMPTWLHSKLHLPKNIRRGLGNDYKKSIAFVEHHQSHAASAFFPSPFEKAAILTMDGTGEWATGSIGVGQGREIRLLGEQHFPHSLGLLYSAFTYFCGFRVNSGEYKLMGLAPYGKPRFASSIREHLIDLKQDGSFRLDMSYFHYHRGLRMTSSKFHRLFGGPPREPESPLTQREMDLAASIQQVTEEVMLKIARHVHEQTRQTKLCLAGGVALNCVANGRLRDEGPFEEIWVQPAAGDAGGALGAALFVWHHLLERERQPEPSDSMRGAQLGPEFSEEEIETALRTEDAVFHKYENQRELDEVISLLLALGRVVGWMQGRMEFGPRALGNRSILADPRAPRMQSHLNLSIKYRESFRPFAPAVLEECAWDHFQLPANERNPYMLLTSQVRDVEIATQERVLEAVRGPLPAITHVDGSARLQIVDQERFPRFHQLLSSFRELTGTGVLINTSFNVRGEPIVCTTSDAYRCFLATEMDVLVIGDYLLIKEEQPRRRERELIRADHDFPLD